MDGRAQRVVVGPGIMDGETGAHFHRVAEDPVDIESLFDDMIGLREGVFGCRPVTDFVDQRFVVADFRPQDGRPLIKCGGRIRRPRQGIEIDHHQICRAFRLRRRFRHDERDPFAHHTYPVDGQRIKIRQEKILSSPAFHGGSDMRDAPPSGIFVVAPGVNRDDAIRRQCIRGVDAGDIGMSMGRAHDDAVKLTVRVVVIDEISPAGQQPGVLEPGNGLTDTVFAQRACPPFAVCFYNIRRNRSERYAGMEVREWQAKEVLGHSGRRPGSACRARWGSHRWRPNSPLNSVRSSRRLALQFCDPGERTGNYCIEIQ